MEKMDGSMRRLCVQKLLSALLTLLAGMALPYAAPARHLSAMLRDEPREVPK